MNRHPKSPLDPAHDPLHAYRSKRDFTLTPEPAQAGKIVSDEMTFVVQKHWASSLHYDLRLELDVTMKSWAVPKGPSVDPNVKRMAVQVEDHPMAYADFEGTVPAKQYGAGKVIVWDAGTWIPLQNPRQGVLDGNLKFELHGHKLHGRWVLVRMKGKSEKQTAWLLIKENIVVDGGNSYYRDDIRRGGELQALGIHYLDVGTSGGVKGLDRGYCLMIGGEPDIVAHVRPVFSSLALGISTAVRIPGRMDKTGSAEEGFLHCGPCGAGHFVKMVHNGIEYGLMAAYAEGFNILRNANVGKKNSVSDAETTPLSHPEFYQFDMNLPEIAEVWWRGSVIGSWLLDLSAQAFQKDPELAAYGGHVSDSGEGRWTIQAAIDEAVPAHVISAALFDRFSSRDGANFANRILSAMRHEFGGHIEKPGL